MSARAKLVCPLVLLLTAGLALAAPGEQNPLPQAMVHVERLGGAGVTGPEPILPTQLAVPETCKGKIKGTVRLTLVVDAQGMAQNIEFVEPLGSDLDKLALLYLDGERFKPGTANGQPVAVGEAVTVDVSACSIEGPKQGKQRTQILHLRELPKLKFSATDTVPANILFGQTVVQNMTREFNATNLHGMDAQHRDGAKEPRLLKYVEAKYSDEARSKHVTGTTVVSLIVDSNGMPEKAHVIRPLGSGLDEQALYAVNMYRFAPALYHNSPVAVTISVQVNFQLY